MKLLPQGILPYALDLLFPPRCASCKRGGHIICPPCIASITAPTLPRCLHCQAQLTPTGVCKHCLSHPLALSGVRAVGIYEGPLRACIHSLKYKGNQRIAEFLGLLLANIYLGQHLQADVLIPVPLHSERHRQRGYNQSALLARVCSAHTGIPQREDILIRSRPTPPQVGSGIQARRHNVSGAFLCTPAFTGGRLTRQRIIIIDDVCTTGATLEACAAPLFAAGARSVWGLVLARPGSGF
jgi:ComF family protein